ncbi:MAG: RDD family protein [Deltaproteobacteria bacterium]|nr:RDD family protein [Deltaproteobacteria bacterium]
MERVGFGKRFLAFLIDLVIVMVGGTVVSFLTGGLMGGMASRAGAPPEASAGLGVLAGVTIFILIGSLYNLIEAFRGQSPGGMILGIIIRNQDGSPADLGTLFYRYAVKNISSLLRLAAAILGLGFLETVGNLAGFVIFLGCFLVLRADRLTLHDMICHTSVYPVRA